MGSRKFSREAYEHVSSRVKDAGGDTSHAGRQTIKDTGKLHPLVDPAGFDVVRLSLPRFVENEKGLILGNGLPMLIETLGDVTGSMGGNVKLMFNQLPKLYALLAEGDNPVLGKYDPQILNAIFTDIVEPYVLMRSQAEMDEKISEQLTLLVPVGSGEDEPEDPEYGLFGAAYLTKAKINEYGLKSYHFTITDAPSHERIDQKNLVRVFGEEVFKKVKENTQQDFTKELPSTAKIIKDLSKNSHAFMILVGTRAYEFWNKYYDESHIVVIPDTGFLAYIQASIIGLTEGVLSLKSLPEFLESYGLNKAESVLIQRALVNVPVGAQTLFENFHKLPVKGSVFANKTDLWPVSESIEISDEAKKEDGWI